MGVTILAVLEVIAGIFMLLGAMGMAFLASMGGQIPGAGVFIGMFAMAMSVIFIVMGIVAFIIAYGLWNGRGWAWWLALIFAVISLLIDLGSMVAGNFSGIIGLIIALIIIYYLTRPHVKEFFGRPA